MRVFWYPHYSHSLLYHSFASGFVKKWNVSHSVQSSESICFLCFILHLIHRLVSELSLNKFLLLRWIQSFYHFGYVCERWSECAQPSSIWHLNCLILASFRSLMALYHCPLLYWSSFDWTQVSICHVCWMYCKQSGFSFHGLILVFWALISKKSWFRFKESL